MQVFKFGGASVSSGQAVRNMANILQQYAPAQNLLIVISAMGKTTNRLEQIVQKIWHVEDFSIEQTSLWEYHQKIIQELFGKDSEQLFSLEIFYQDFFATLKQEEIAENFDELYDQVVSFGEIISSKIVGSFLAEQGLSCQWVDARTMIFTDQQWREGQVQWQETQKNIFQQLVPILQQGWAITQGFLGGTSQGKTTTLGREGSDFSAAIFAYCLDAQNVTIWKDVAGFLNADPKKVADTRLYQELSYKETAEMSRYGASVIHPKTIAPLAEKKIPLFVKSFLQPDALGTKIHHKAERSFVPAIIFKPAQVLLSFETKALGFMDSSALEKILKVCEQLHVPIQLLQRFAMHLSLLTDNRPTKLQSLQELLQADFDITLIENLELLTLKNYQQSLIEQFTEEKEVILVQIQENRGIFQAVLR